LLNWWQKLYYLRQKKTLSVFYAKIKEVKKADRALHFLTISKNIERIMSTCAICLSSESNMSMLTAVNLNVVKWIAEALLSKIEKDSVNLLC